MPRRKQLTSISGVKAREVLDSRGFPTVQVDVTLSDGCWGRFTVPSGASTGTHEALELRDGDSSRFGGRGVLKVVRNIHDQIAPTLRGLDALQQEAVDRALIELDGTPNKGRLGANALLGVSMAVASAAARSAGEPLYEHLHNGGPLILPVPMLNIINGGRHAEDSTDFQEFMVVPAGFDGFSQALRAGVEVYHALKGLIRDRGMSTAVGDEGGFVPSLPSNHAAVELLVAAIEKVGYAPGVQCFIALDVAATELVGEDGGYRLAREGTTLGSEELVDRYEDWVNKYPIVSIEDGMAEEDWDGWRRMAQRLGGRVQLVGDDLYTTNTARIQKGIETEGQQRRARQAEPDRHPDGDAGGGGPDKKGRMGHRHQPPVRRNRRLRHSGPGGGDFGGPDQVGGPGQRRADRQVQPAAAYRGGVGRPRGLRGPQGLRDSRPMKAYHDSLVKSLCRSN